MRSGRKIVLVTKYYQVLEIKAGHVTGHVTCLGKVHTVLVGKSESKGPPGRWVGG